MVTQAEKLLWQPSAERIEKSQLARFMTLVRQRTSIEARDYSQLWQWSVDQPEAFWPLVWEFGGVLASRPWEAVLQNAGAMPGASWFTGARLNFAQNLMRRNDDKPALVFWGEDGERFEVTYDTLQTQVAQLACQFTEWGIEPGERIGAIMPNRPEAVIAMLAAARLGAIWSSCSPDFGTAGILDRLGQIQPQVLIACDGYRFKGKAIDGMVKLREVAQSLSSVKHVILVPWLGEAPDLNDLPAALTWRAALCHEAGDAPPFVQLAFDHPLYILFSSGTTGPPKCIVHSAGGTLLQHLKELVLHTDLTAEDKLFFFTTTGWMMWNWLVSGLATGATLVLFDGNPFHPTRAALWDVAEQEQLTVFGTSAKYLAALEKSGVRPRASHELTGLRTILTTGSPLAPEQFDYVYRAVKPDLQLSSISGGTDIVSCFALGCPILPVYRGQLQCRGLGMAVAVFDQTGRAVQGEPGELVCIKPFPAMPLGFWGDPGGERYHAAYFERFPGTWHHGDWCELTPQHGLIIHGRSDTVLNPGGVRIGTAEIYRQVEKIEAVLECVAVGQDWQGDQRIVLYVVLRDGLSLDDDLQARIRQVLQENTTPRHVPAVILQVADIPRTRSGKVSEAAVRDAIHGRPIKNTEALANPEALAEYVAPA
jgi:acetoacetyl-CoA synthetase